MKYYVASFSFDGVRFKRGKTYIVDCIKSGLEIMPLAYLLNMLKKD